MFEVFSYPFVRNYHSNPVVEESFNFNCITNVFYERSLLFALDKNAISEKTHLYQDLSWAQQIKVGAISGIQDFAFGYLLLAVASIALKKMKPGKKASRPFPSKTEVILGAIAEEILFRGCLQNLMARTQNFAIKNCPSLLSHNASIWLVSPGARILTCNLVFSAIHLSNSGDYLSNKGSLIQSARILLMPTESILHETTGNIIAPIVSHLVNNVLVVTYLQLKDIKICRALTQARVKLLRLFSKPEKKLTFLESLGLKIKQYFAWSMKWVRDGL
ncbi:MAG: CPBP family intramembrane metalloprotease [Chlamydiales bacterium]|nr:CPBP family intramembrane metalloprotease [Chlamydiales bacterium]